MKKAAVATTAARGAAVSSSRITAVQSVYIVEVMLTKLPFQQVQRESRTPGPCGGLGRARALPLALALTLLAGVSQPAGAGVRFENCRSGADGSLSCDTVPTGDTLADDEAARFGLFQNASPGWNEFDPFAGYEDDFGGNQT